jgi:signal transduction histidine kinase
VEALIRRIRLVDVAIAGALLALAEAEVALGRAGYASWTAALVALAYTAPLALRRLAPGAVLVWTIAMLAVLAWLDPHGAQSATALAVLVVSFTVGRELDAPRAWVLSGLGLGFIWTLTLAEGGNVEDVAFVTLLYGGAWAFGQALRVRAQRLLDVTERADRVEREREARERQAVEQERVRIARELHDIVSHSISLVTVKTQALRRRLEPTQQQEIEELREIEAVARQAMAELRRLFGALRDDGERPPLEPQPGLGELPALVEQARAAGASVELRLAGEPTPLAPGVDLAAYRIVQEAITNVLKHARPAAATVSISFLPDLLEIEVQDTGAARTAVNGAGGSGLIGMRERVALYGGDFAAGPSKDGGFSVHATIPLREPAGA